jgi:RsiW-degrading membrane proteinase PrsW (M82 family)
VLLYFPRLLAEGDTPTLLLRSVLTVLMHAVASGILGYFYGLATSRRGSPPRTRGRGTCIDGCTGSSLFRRESLYHEAKMFEASVLAGAYHAAFNLAAAPGRRHDDARPGRWGCAFL